MVGDLMVAVAELNGVLQDTIDDEDIVVTLETNGYDQIVKFAGIRIWDSMDGLGDDEEMSLEEYFRIRIRQVIETMGRIKV